MKTSDFILQGRKPKLISSIIVLNMFLVPIKLLSAQF
jgi:hypothetical protein